MPSFKRAGIGSALMRHTVGEAKRLGYRAIIFYGHPDYYPRFGFQRSSAFGITGADGGSRDALMAMPLYDGALDGVSGRYMEDPVYQVDSKEAEAFDQTFPPKEPVVLLPIERLCDTLPAHIGQAFAKRKIRTVAQLQEYSGVEMLGWDGIGEQDIKEINIRLKETGYAEKLLPNSYILQLAEMGVRVPVVTLLREKDGIGVYRVASEGKRYILKVFEKSEDTREIENYKMLSALQIPTLPMLKHTKRALLLPDVAHDERYRLGCESDLTDTKTAAAIALWYKALHEKGRAYMETNGPDLYDETDVITLDNMQRIAEKTGTAENEVWRLFQERFPEIRRLNDALPRTLAYNDFYWTNLIVSKDQTSAMMLDYNLLGKGYAYGDIRNVTSAMGKEARAAFLQAYGPGREIEAEKMADAVLSPIFSLVVACQREPFPQWAEFSLNAVKSGALLADLRRWLDGDFPSPNRVAREEITNGDR